MMRRIVALAAVLALAPAAVLAAQGAQPSPTLAVLDLTDGGSLGPDAHDLSALGKGLAAMLTTELARNPRVQVVERDRIRALLDEQRLSLSGTADEATAVRVGRLLGAQYMLFGSYADVYGQLRIDVRVVEVETGRLRRAQEVTDRRENLFRSVTTLAAETFRDLALQPQPRADAAPVPAQAALLFSRGLAMEDAGDRAGAGALYRQALQLAPAYGDAQTRLARLGASNASGGPSTAVRPSAAPSTGSGAVRLDSELPRVLVLLKDDGGTATGAIAGFLREGGFPLVDPAFARDAAQRDRVARALAGSEADAVAVGRDLGAQVVIVGQAPADAGAAPADPSLQTGTAQLNVRALRLDDGRVVSTATAQGRAVEATAGGARAAALRQAAEQLVRQSRFLGDVVNDWTGKAWNGAAYWTPEPGSVPAQLAIPDRARGTADLLPLAIVEAVAFPDSGARGITVSARTPMRARVRGVLPVTQAEVRVAGRPARVRALSADEQSRYALAQPGVLFEGEAPLAAGADTVRVQAQSGRAMTQAVVRAGVGKRWAVVVGISRYADASVPALKYADADARSMYDFLRSPAGGAIPEGQVRLLLNEQATTAAIRDALFVFLQQAAEDDQVTVYVASHGAPDPHRPSNLYILSYDTDLRRVASTAFPMWDFQTALRRQIAAQRVVVIADACHSAGALVSDATPINEAFAGLFTPSMRVTLSAADGGEFSREGPQWGGGHGVFTWTLLNGLKGDADADHDGVVTFTEAAAYVRSHVAQATNGEQNPQRAGLGDVPLAFVAAR